MVVAAAGQGEGERGGTTMNERRVSSTQLRTRSPRSRCNFCRVPGRGKIFCGGIDERGGLVPQDKRVGETRRTRASGSKA